MTLRPDTIIRTDAELEEFWRELMGPLGFARRALWIALVEDDGLALRQIVEIGDLPRRPDRGGLAGLPDNLAGLSDDLGIHRFAFLLVRPGRGGAAPDDRAWAAELHRAAHIAGVRCETVHLATDTDLVPLPVDDLPTP
jgi:hypothetical protein